MHNYHVLWIVDLYMYFIDFGPNEPRVATKSTKT
jgi:hypothetical protein